MNFGIQKKKHNYNDSSPLQIVAMSVLIIVLIVVGAWLLGGNKNYTYSLALNGDDVVVVYEGNNYVDPGVSAYDENENDLSSKVIVDGKVNVNKPGKYVITYTLDDLSVKRVVKVVEKSSGGSSSGNGSSSPVPPLL